MKEFLSRGGHAFTVRNVHEDAAAYDALLALGYRRIPVTQIGGVVVCGFDPAALAAALAAAATDG